MSEQTKETGASADELADLVASTDTGGRQPGKVWTAVLFSTALAWSLFQLWFASPLPFALHIGVFNDTEARSIHLAFAIFLAFLAYPAFSRSPRNYIPILDIVFAFVGAASASYLFVFYRDIADRVGAPIEQDFVVAVIGVLLLLEATRRALGPALAIVASVFLLYTFFGPYMPGIIAHKGNSLAEVVNHHWITTEGVFGIALGVSTSFVFLFVLFGALLDKAGAGNYFIQVAFSLMGHMKGGPAKAAVVASAMTGLISGSSIANVVTTGTFTIPLMKRVGFSSEKAGAVEVASSVNGQIMPPVMGAAAFLMVEYVGIPYFDVVKHAFVPALISYIALVYIVHLEAMKLGMEGLPRAVEPKPWVQRLVGLAFGIAMVSGLSLAVYYGLGWMKPILGGYASLVVAFGIAVVYVLLVRFAAQYPDLKMDDPNQPVLSLPEPAPTIKSGLHFLLPVIVLVWCLMVEQLSPGLSAFWGSVLMIFILLTQRPIYAYFRNQTDFNAQIKRGWYELLDGLVTGARNMIGIGIATATAGIIVGVVSQTGVGSALADVVEVLSGGNLMAILFLTAFLSLILGMGLPTTANYIVVSALLAPVIVTLGQQNGLIVPLIAVHLFVFYFGIMADVTPPVGLASFAAAAVSGGDPIRTGFVAFFYSLRTAALPFLFIFNTDLLLIDVDALHGVFVFITATLAMLLFAAATQGYFLTRSKIWETAILLLLAFSFFRPGFWMDMVSAPYIDHKPAEMATAFEKTPEGEKIRLMISGKDDIGNPREWMVVLPMGPAASGDERIKAAGITVREEDGKILIDDVAFGSEAKKVGLDWDQEITHVLQPADQLNKYWVYLPALLILGLVVLAQKARIRKTSAQAA
ncbi:MAG: C4-dicarboxylate ABC transporter [Magnetovibrio sp.]|nr:C4-dicarboxylate ABC transporter [Magnetovibrio sp.]|tara:strand:- start:4391 stop:6982 length:2592 start_codon:yes stop_codon:yes gene_type:complete